MGNMPDCVARRVWKKIKLAGAVFKHWLPGTANSEHICLAQAREMHEWCSNPPSVTVRAWFAESGARVAYPPPRQGCWIAQDKCEGYPQYTGFFRDVSAEETLAAGRDQIACLDQASSWAAKCGHEAAAGTSALFAPTGAMQRSGPSKTRQWTLVASIKQARQPLSVVSYLEGVGTEAAQDWVQSCHVFGELEDWILKVQLLVAPHSISYFRPETVGYTLCQVLTSYNPDAKFIWSAREHSPDWRIPDAPEGGLGGSVDGWGKQVPFWGDEVRPGGCCSTGSSRAGWGTPFKMWVAARDGTILNSNMNVSAI